MDTVKLNIFEQTRAPKGKFRLVVMKEQKVFSSENDAAGLTIRDFHHLAIAKRAADRSVCNGIIAEVFNDENECVYHGIRQ